MEIQPIYIYKFECLSSKYVRYVLFDSKDYLAQEEICLLVHNAGKGYDLYVNQEINKRFDLCERRMWNKLEDIIHFRTYSVNCNDVKQLLQLVIANWDDWY
jgi:hypothetical protein